LSGLILREGREREGDERGVRRREGRGGLFGNVPEEAFCLISAPVCIIQHRGLKTINQSINQFIR